MVEKRHRIEDALEAVKSAQLEGVLPGGGTFLVQKSKHLYQKTKTTADNEWEELGIKIVESAIREPLRQMANNAGQSADLILSKVMHRRNAEGYNFKTSKMANMVESGIIDPARVTRCALQNAVSVAGTLITSNYAIVES